MRSPNHEKAPSGRQTVGALDKTPQSHFSNAVPLRQSMAKFSRRPSRTNVARALRQVEILWRLPPSAKECADTGGLSPPSKVAPMSIDKQIDPRAAAWDRLTGQRVDSVKTWLKVELMILFHRGHLPADAADALMAHFKLAAA